jgi:hypothetical protein
MIDPGSLALGALLVVAFVVAWFAWLARGHRLDLRGVRIVSTRDVPMGWPPIDTDKKPEDYFAQAQERSE